MAHSDDAGLVLPPKLAPIQVVIVPIYKHDEELDNITTFVNALTKELRSKDITVKFDKRDTHRPGRKICRVRAERCTIARCYWQPRYAKRYS
jgi:prolyl-tRNA synthetase